MSVQIVNDGQTIKITNNSVSQSITKSGTTVRCVGDVVYIEDPAGLKPAIDFNDVTSPVVASCEELRDEIVKLINKSVNTNDTATLSDAISVDSLASTTLSSSNVDRIYVGITVRGKDVWLKLQSAATDDDAKGIYMPKDSFYELPADNMYIGEISAIASSGVASVYVTEY
jgi:hypothetical protein